MENVMTQKGYIIDLSSMKSTAQLVAELNSIMERSDIKERKICLKLGEIDLKQSQLLSIKALLEAVNSKIECIDTTSEQTIASATSLGISISSLSEESAEIYKAQIQEESSTDENSNIDRTEIPTVDLIPDETVKVDADITYSDNSPITTVEGVDDIYTEETMDELSEIIQIETFDNNFEKLALSEGLLNREETSKYILLDTGEVLPENPEESSIDTKTLPTLYLNQTLRSGQTVNYEGNIFIIGDVHPGSELVAHGDITVWGILGGIAHAGSNGNITAKVRALKLNAIQLRIAGLYARRNDTLNVPYVQKSNEFTPEEAQIENGRIVIYKKLRRD